MTKIEAIGAATAAAMLFLFLGLLLVTPGYWMDLRRIEFADAKAGQPIQMQYDRAFYRDFNGGWSVAIWVFERGEWTPYCHAEGSWPYRAGEPDPSRKLEWLVDGDERCTNLPPGIYQAEVTVTANPDTLIARSETILSNAFEVRP